MNTAPETETQSSSPAKPYTRRNESQWRELVSAFDTSQQSVAEYCRNNNIAVSGFYTWRKRFEDEPSSQEASSFIPITRHTDTQHTSELPSSSEFSTAPAWDVELEIRRDYILRLRIK